MGKQSISVHNLRQLVSSGDLRIYRFFVITCWMDDFGAGPVDHAAFNRLVVSERSASWMLLDVRRQMIVNGGSAAGFLAVPAWPWSHYSSGLVSIVVVCGITDVGEGSFFCYRHLNLLWRIVNRGGGAVEAHQCRRLRISGSCIRLRTTLRSLGTWSKPWKETVTHSVCRSDYGMTIHNGVIVLKPRNSQIKIISQEIYSGVDGSSCFLTASSATVRIG